MAGDLGTHRSAGDMGRDLAQGPALLKVQMPSPVHLRFPHREGLDLRELMVGEDSHVGLGGCLCNWGGD